jgi:serine protease
MIKRLLGGGLVAALSLLGFAPAVHATPPPAPPRPHVLYLRVPFQRDVPHAKARDIGGIVYTQRRNLVAGGMRRAAAAGAAAGTASCAEPDCLLTYGGGPVQHHPHVYLLLWGPAWASDPAQAAAATYLESFYAGLGTAPADAWSTITSQYSDGSGFPAFGTSVYQGAYQDTSAPPVGVNDTQLAAEADAFASSQKITDLADAQIVVATQSGTCPQGFYAPSCAGGSGYYCAWHAMSSEPFINLPYQADAGQACGANLVQGADDGFSIVGGHEYAETVTDPAAGNGWFDSADPLGGEIGDKCSWYDPVSGMPNTTAVTLSTGTFAMQPLFSNIAYSVTGDGCTTSPVTVANPGSQVTTAGKPVSLQIRAGSAVSGGVSYAAAGLPAGLSIGPTSGLITGKPTAAGSHSVTVRVTGSSGASGSATFSWQVKAAFKGAAVRGYRGRCLSTRWDRTSTGTPVTITRCHGGPGQLWAPGPAGRLVLASGTCLADPGGGGPGTRLLLERCNGRAVQHWTHLANGEYRLSFRGLCLTDPGYSTRNGTRLIVAICRDTANQRWTRA